MARVDAVIFDLGNVLVFHDNELLYQRLAERAGVTPAAVRQALAEPELFFAINRGWLDADGIRRTVCRAIGADLTADEFAALWCCHFQVHRAVLPLVERLVGRVRLLLLSNTNVLHTAYLRPRLPLLDRFDHLLFSHDLGLVKPETAFYQAALGRAGVRPDRTAFFDDVPEFVAAARALGIHGYVFQDLATFTRDLVDLGLLEGAEARIPAP
jgi:putative hydrolase of the HAD superfamily